MTLDAALVSKKTKKKLTLLQAPHHMNMIGARDAGLERLCIDPVPSSCRKLGPTRMVKEASRKAEKAA